MDVIVVAAVRVPRSRRCSRRTSYGTQAPADRCTDARAMPAASNRADYSPGASPQQPATDCSLRRIIGIR